MFVETFPPLFHKILTNLGARQRQKTGEAAISVMVDKYKQYGG